MARNWTRRSSLGPLSRPGALEPRELAEDSGVTDEPRGAFGGVALAQIVRSADEVDAVTAAAGGGRCRNDETTGADLLRSLIIGGLGALPDYDRST